MKKFWVAVSGFVKSCELKLSSSDGLVSSLHVSFVYVISHSVGKYDNERKLCHQKKNSRLINCPMVNVHLCKNVVVNFDTGLLTRI